MSNKLTDHIPLFEAKLDMVERQITLMGEVLVELKKTMTETRASLLKFRE